MILYTLLYYRLEDVKNVESSEVQIIEFRNHVWDSTALHDKSWYRNFLSEQVILSRLISVRIGATCTPDVP